MQLQHDVVVRCPLPLGDAEHGLDPRYPGYLATDVGEKPARVPLEGLTDMPNPGLARGIDVGEDPEDAPASGRPRWEGVGMQAPIVLAIGRNGATFDLVRSE